MLPGMIRTVAVAMAVFIGGFAIAGSPPRRLANPSFELTRGGIVYASARQPDGSLVLIGSFRSINGVPRNGIGRIRPNGTVDPNWGPDWFAPQFGAPLLIADSTGAIYINGTTPDSQSLTKLAADTGKVVVGWGASPINFAYGLSVDETGLYVGTGHGTFKLALDTGAVLWGADEGVDNVALDGHGSLYAVVKSAGDAGRYALARFSSATGERSTNWTPAISPVAGYTYPLVADGCGAVYVAGSSSIGGAAVQSGIVKISAATGAIDNHWNPGEVRSVTAIAADAGCALYVGGDFHRIGTQPARGLVKLDGSDGHVVGNWLPEGACCGINALTLETPDQIRVSGGFEDIGGQTRLGQATLSVDSGEILASADAEADPVVEAITADPDGGVIVGGLFAKAGAATRHGLLRLRPNGTLDMQWTPSSIRSQLSALAVRPGKKVYLAGALTEVKGAKSQSLVRLTGPDGALDTQWTPLADSNVDALAFDADGSVYAGGLFSTVNGQASPFLAKLSGDTGLPVPGWNSGANGPISALASDEVGGLYVAGTFTQLGGENRAGLAKMVGSTGQIVTGWTGAASAGASFASYADGVLYLGYGMGGALLKLSSANGTQVPGWNGVGTVRAFALSPAPDGALFATVMDSDYRNYLRRYDAVTGAMDSNWNIPVAGGNPPVAVDDRGIVYTVTEDGRGIAAFSADSIFFDSFDP